MAYNFWLGGALGCLVFLMLQYVTGGAGACFCGASWRRRPARCRSWPCCSFPLLSAAIRSKYTQSNPVQTGEESHFKARVAQSPFFLVRAVVYFAFWLGMARLLR